MFFLNPVVLSVITMIVLCLLNLNVLFALLVAALVGGVASGMPFNEVLPTLVGGMGGASETALSYIMLGTFAVFINQVGLAAVLARKIASVVTGKRVLFLFIIAGVACLSQNLIPIHISFIPILIPPLLYVMNKEKLDRRAVACALTFGLKAPYIALPVGFGLIFHGIVVSSLKDNGVNVTLADTSKIMWVIAASMFLGLIFAIFVSYRKNREYKDIKITEGDEVVNDKLTKAHWFTIIATLLAFTIQIIWGSLPLGALVAILFLAITRTIKFSDIDKGMAGGIKLMGFIAFVMLVAAGYATVIRETGAVASLVEDVVGVVGNNKPVAAFVMLIVGLLITMGIGTSFGTIPILAAIYCPLALELGFSPTAIIILVAAAGALGDAGSPASDSTLGPTAGLNVDGQHRHIWDTCVPTFLHYNIPIIIVSLIVSLIV